jgi:hypothetical protein
MLNNLERRRFEMMIRVKDFIATRPEQFAAGAAGQLAATVSTTVDELTRFAGEKSSRRSDSREKQNRKSDAREALRETLNAISRTARAMASQVPAASEKFRIPQSLSDVTLLATARAFAADAAPFQADFQAYELPQNFLDELRADIADFEAAASERNTAAESASTTLTVIEEAVARGMAAVMALDAVLKNRYRNDTASLNAWTRASHVERATRATTPAPQTSAASV